MRTILARSMAFLAIAFVVTTAQTNLTWAQGGGICRICGRPLRDPPEPRCLAIGKVVMRAGLEVERTPVAAERVPADISGRLLPFFGFRGGEPPWCNGG
jgi:hypothetical protein